MTQQRAVSLLASVRSVEEAREAAAGGADLIDLKDPSSGALGGLPLDEIARIVGSIRRDWPLRPVSATIGDFDAGDHAGRCAQAAAVACCGVDYVKAGVDPGEHAPEALRSLASLRLPNLVIVLLADAGIDKRLVEEAAALGFAGIMVDTGDKSAGSLLQRVDRQSLRDLISVARHHGCLSGLAGSLRRPDVDALRQLAPDFAGFRGALCDGDRRGRFDAAKLRDLRAALQAGLIQDDGDSCTPGNERSTASIRERSLLPSNSIG